MQFVIRLFALLMFVFSVHVVSAATVFTKLGTNTVQPVSNADLINGITPTVTGTALPGAESTSNNPAILSNGQFGTADKNGAPLEIVTIASGNTTLTYQLNLGAAPTGYNISNINTYSGWNDAGRDDQRYQVLYSTVGNPLTFLPILNINEAGTDPNGANPDNLGIFISDNLGGFIAQNVGAIQFIFANPQENGHVGYREFDVFGVAAPVPEPASIALWSMFGAAGLGWAVYRGRR